MFQEIDNLKTKGPSEKDAREALFREYETGMKQKGWLLKLKFEASLFQTQDGSIPVNIQKTVTANVKGYHLFHLLSLGSNENRRGFRKTFLLGQNIGYAKTGYLSGWEG